MNPIDLTGSIEANNRVRDFTRYLRCFALSKGDPLQAVAMFEAKWPRTKHLDIVRKAAVAVGNTTDANWAAPLAPMTTLASEFVTYIRARTVLGRMAGYRSVPFNIRFARQTVGSSVSWVGQGQPTSGTAMGFDAATFEQSKIAGFVVLTDELARSSDPAAEALAQADLTDAIVGFSDQQMLDPTVAAVGDKSPAAITYGATNIPSSGSDDDAIEADLVKLIGAIKTNLTAPYLIMKQTTAVYLATLRTTAGDRVFPNIGVLGGSIWGIPVLVSASTPSTIVGGSPPTATGFIVLVDAAEMLVADGGIEFDASGEATIQLNTTPDAPPTATTVFTSLWQMNLVALMAKRYVRWEMRRPDAVAYISGITY